MKKSQALQFIPPLSGDLVLGASSTGSLSFFVPRGRFLRSVKWYGNLQMGAGGTGYMYGWLSPLDPANNTLIQQGKTRNEAVWSSFVMAGAAASQDYAVNFQDFVYLFVDRDITLFAGFTTTNNAPGFGMVTLQFS